MRLREEVRRGLLASAGVFAASRIVALVAAYFATRVPPETSLRHVLSTWDGAFYLDAARYGWSRQLPAPPAASAHAFFPGYPLLIRLVHWTTRLSWFRSALAVSLLTGLAGMLLLWLVMERATDGDGEAALRTVALMSFFPWAFVFSMTYSEGLLLVATCACLLFLMDERWLLAGLTAAVAGVCRPNGFVLALPCAWAALMAMRRAGRVLVRPLLAPVLAPMGMVAFFWFLKVRTGDFLANVHVKDRAMGGQGIGLDFSNVGPHWRFFIHGPLHDVNFLTSFVSLAIVAAALVVVWRVPGWRPSTLLWLYAVPVVLLAAWFTTFGSTLRFVMTAFPFLAVFSTRLRGTAFAVVLACSAVLMGAVMVMVGSTLLLTP